MIQLKVSNASELVASKFGQLLERFTPGDIDQSASEDQIIKKMIESLSKEALKGKISALEGIDIDSEKLLVEEVLKVRSLNRF